MKKLLSYYAIHGDWVSRAEIEQKLRQQKLLFGNFTGLFRTEPCDDVSSSGNFILGANIANDIYTRYDAMMDSNNLIITKNHLGNGGDSDGNEDLTLPIYEYTIKNPQSRPDRKLEDNSKLILVVTGLHGNEKSTVWGTLLLFEQLLAGWVSNDTLASVKSNVTFKIIPVANPGGYNANTRGNLRGVDLNRNFSHNWISGSDRGSAPYSERETVILTDWLNANAGADILLDYHNTGATYDASYLATENGDMQNVYASTIRRLTDIWKKHYSLENDNISYGWTERSTISGLVSEAYEVVGINHSAILEVAWDFGGARYNSTAIEVSVELLANYLLAMLHYTN